MRPRSRGFLLRTAALAVLVGAGIAIAVVARGGNESQATVTPARPAALAQQAPAQPVGVALGCPKPSGRPTKLPAVFPNFPLPRGTVVEQVIRRPLVGSGTVVMVVTYAPTTFERGIRFLLRELPRRGFTLAGGESEPPREAEGAFMYPKGRGGFRLLSLPGCSTSILVVQLVIPPKS